MKKFADHFSPKEHVFTFCFRPRDVMLPRYYGRACEFNMLILVLKGSMGFLLFLDERLILCIIQEKISSSISL